jgi:hypothetical protein
VSNNKRRHHFLPEAYLRGFANKEDSNWLWLYEKGSSKVVRSSPKDVFVRKDFYAVELGEKEKDFNKIENVISDFENLTIPSVRKITNKEDLSDHDIKNVADFVAFCINRVPTFQHSVNRMGETMARETARILSKRDVFLPTPPSLGADKTVHDLLEEGVIKVEVKSPFRLAMMGAFTGTSEVLLEMDWCFLQSEPGFRFITSDNPVAIADPDFVPGTRGLGVAFLNAEVTFPLSPKICFIAARQNFRKRYVRIPRRDIDQINRRTAMFAERYVVASEESPRISRLVERYATMRMTHKIDVTRVEDQEDAQPAGSYTQVTNTFDSREAEETYVREVRMIAPSLPHFPPMR